MAKKTTTTIAKEKAFALGDKGVNIVSTPLHAEPGELQSAQNVIFSLDRAKHGLTKRPGMTKFNAVAAGGTILAMQSVPLPVPEWEAADEDAVTPDGTTLFVFSESTHAGTGRRSSPDGTTWTQTGSTDLYSQLYEQAILLHKTGGILVLAIEKLATDPLVFQEFDGTTFSAAFTLATRTLSGCTYTPRTLWGWDQDDDNFYLLVRMVLATGAGASHAQLIQVNKDTYAETYVGLPFAEAAATALPAGTPTYIRFDVGGISIGVAAIHHGNIFVQAMQISGTYYEGRIYMLEPGSAYDTAWTLDYRTGTPAVGKAYASKGIVGHGTQLWAGWTHMGAYATVPIFLKREGEVWSIVESGVSAGENFFQPIYALGDTVYAWKTIDPAGTQLELWYSTDAWATSAQVTGVVPTVTTIPFTRALRWSVDNKLYCVTAYGGSYSTYEIWQINAGAGTRVYLNNAGGGALGNCGPAMIGAAVAPPAPATVPYAPADPVPADPVLPAVPPAVAPTAGVSTTTDTPIPAATPTPVALPVVAPIVPPPVPPVVAPVAFYFSTDTSELVVPYGGEGYYLLTAQVAWAPASGTRGFWASIQVNWREVARSYTEGIGGGGNIFNRVSALVYLVAGQRLQVVVQQSGPGVWSMIAGASETFFQAIRFQ